MQTIPPNWNGIFEESKMVDHLIVLFDKSGSMNAPFRASLESALNADETVPDKRKIDAAKKKLIQRLKKVGFEKVTIIPFDTKPEEPFTRNLPNELDDIERFIDRIQPGGDTLLALALQQAIEIATAEGANSYIRYLVITDGLSHTVDQDIVLANKIDKNQGIEGILIDPTEEGERYLKSICVRGSYFSVASSEQFDSALSTVGKEYERRSKISHQFKSFCDKGDEFRDRRECNQFC
jgi:hypothetical protein